MKFLGNKKVPQGTNEVPWKKTFIKNKKSSPKKRVISLGNNFLGQRPKFPMDKGNFLKKQWTLLGEGPKFLKETYVLNLFVITTFSFSFLYRLATYHSKGFEEGYNFVSESTSIIIHIMVAPWANHVPRWTNVSNFLCDNNFFIWILIEVYSITKL
jgi:hypothetical protein